MKKSILFSEVLPVDTLVRIALVLDARIVERIALLVDNHDINTYLDVDREMKAIKKMKGQVVCIRKYLSKPHPPKFTFNSLKLKSHEKVIFTSH